MLILNAADVSKLFPMKLAIESDKQAFAMQSNGDTELPVRITFNVKENSTSQFMPAFVKGGVNRVGIKTISTFPGNPKIGKPVTIGQLMLLDNETGEVCCLMNGTEVTKIRTAAITGAAIDILARRDAEIGALFGTGGMAPRQLEAMLCTRNFKEIRIYDLAQERISAFIERNAQIAEMYGTKLTAACCPDCAVDGADVITTVTVSPTPTFKGALVKPGAHVTGIGSYRPATRELDTDIITRSRVFMDNREAVLEEAGDILIPISEGKYAAERIAGELGEVINGKIAGRESNEQITVMKAVGFAVLDVVAACNIYDAAVKNGVGTEFEF